MKISLEPLKLINTKISLYPPKKLEKLAKNYKANNKFPDLKNSFEFPPKTIEKILEILFKKDFKRLNFFDILKLLSKIKENKLDIKIKDRTLFTQLLQKLFNNSEQNIKNLILKVIARILRSKDNNDLRTQLSQNLISNEFKFIKYCIDNNFRAIKKSIPNQSLKKVLKYFSLKTVFIDLDKDYSNYLITEIERIIITEENINTYKNNLLDNEDIKYFYQQIKKLISLIERKVNTKYLDNLLVDKLGDIEDKNSNWHILQVPLDLQNKYKRLKGIFEFQRFVTIAEHLSPSLINSNPNKNGNTNDSTRLTNRSLFWSNYDERFSSVQMWISQEDYENILFNKVVSLDKIKELENINNEVCMLEFKEVELLIIIFFRNRDNREDFYSLIFENDIISVKEILLNKNFQRNTYYQLKSIASFKLNERKCCWVGWVDKFLRDRGVYPNQSILKQQSQFKITPTFKIIYDNQGLESTRNEAIKKDSNYDDVIQINK